VSEWVRRQTRHYLSVILPGIPLAQLTISINSASAKWSMLVNNSSAVSCGRLLALARCTGGSIFKRCSTKGCMALSSGRVPDKGHICDPDLESGSTNGRTEQTWGSRLNDADWSVYCADICQMNAAITECNALIKTLLISYWHPKNNKAQVSPSI